MRRASVAACLVVAEAYVGVWRIYEGGKAQIYRAGLPRGVCDHRCLVRVGAPRLEYCYSAVELTRTRHYALPCWRNDASVEHGICWTGRHANRDSSCVAVTVCRPDTRGVALQPPGRTAVPAPIPQLAALRSFRLQSDRAQGSQTPPARLPSRAKSFAFGASESSGATAAHSGATPPAPGTSGSTEKASGWH